MADDQKNKPFDATQGKTSTIDDLVKQLANNGTSGSPMASPSGPPPNLPGVRVDNKPPAPATSIRPEPPKPPQPIPSQTTQPMPASSANTQATVSGWTRQADPGSGV